MTNFEKIQAMSVQELAEFMARDDLRQEIDNTFCSKICKHSTEEGCEFDGYEMPCVYVKNDDNVTPIKEWLESEESE